jgi:hypothetical protein
VGSKEVLEIVERNDEDRVLGLEYLNKELRLIEMEK